MKRTRGLHFNDPCLGILYAFIETHISTGNNVFFSIFQPKAYNEKIGSVGSESGYAVLMHIPFEIMNGALCRSAVEIG